MICRDWCHFTCENVPNLDRCLLSGASYLVQNFSFKKFLRFEDMLTVLLLVPLGGAVRNTALQYFSDHESLSTPVHNTVWHIPSLLTCAGRYMWAKHNKVKHKDNGTTIRPLLWSKKQFTFSHLWWCHNLCSFTSVASCRKVPLLKEARFMAHRRKAFPKQNSLGIFSGCMVSQGIPKWKRIVEHMTESRFSSDTVLSNRFSKRCLSTAYRILQFHSEEPRIDINGSAVPFHGWLVHQVYLSYVGGASGWQDFQDWKVITNCIPCVWHFIF